MFSFLYHCQDFFRTKFFGSVCVANRFSILCCPIMYLSVLSFVMLCPLRFLRRKRCLVFLNVQLSVEGSCLIYVMCVCLGIVVPNTYCVFVLHLQECHVLFMLCVFVHQILCFLFCFCFVFRRFVRPVFPVSMDCQFIWWDPCYSSFQFFCVVLLCIFTF